MFLPSTDSFVLIRRTIVRPSFPVFLPSTDSFVLIRKPIVEIETSFVPEIEKALVTITESTEEREQIKVSDHGKRNFLKAAGVVGVGVIVSQLAPKKAHALIMGSSPTTGVVGVKDSANERINPATEETVSSLLKPTDLDFDGSGYLNVNVQTTSASGTSSFSDSGNVSRLGLVDGDRHIQVDVLSSVLPSSASSETTLQTISFGGFKFTLRLATVGDIDYVGEASIGTTTSAASWRVKKIDNTSGIIVQWAGTGVFDQIWDNRASLTYS
ncbi:MAG: hypothetical protein AAB726_03475 [Patescibacteria group bacterium]